MPDDTLHLACGGDLAYAPHTAAMIHSVLSHRGDRDVVVHYLHGPDLTGDARARLAGTTRDHGGELDPVEIGDDRLAGLPEIGHLTRAMWYRAFLPEVLPDVPRVLYLDADTLAADDLRPLWDTDLGDDHVAAVTNVWEPWNSGYPDQLDLRRPYFNSGVLLMDLDRLRESGAAARIFEDARGQRHLPWGDQDSLNVVLGPHRHELHPRWNCMTSLTQLPAEAEQVFGRNHLREAVERPGIRHFEGPPIIKPWHRDCPLEDRDLYRRHREATRFVPFVPEGDPAPGRLRRVLRRLRP